MNYYASDSVECILPEGHMEVGMIISQLEYTERSGVRVYIDGEYAFSLVLKEIKQYKLHEGAELSLTVYEQILRETIYHKALQKALSVLTYMDRSEQELRIKLAGADYPQEVIEMVIKFVKNYHYLDEERFAAAYIRGKMYRKSKYVIKNELRRKGVPETVIETSLRNEYEEEGREDAELEVIKKEIAKKTDDVQNLTDEQRKKITASLYRKGFELGKIKHFI